VLNYKQCKKGTLSRWATNPHWAHSEKRRRSEGEAKEKRRRSEGEARWLSYYKLLRTLKSTLRRWSHLHLQSLAPTHPHWARVVCYGPISLFVILKEHRCPSREDINMLMMMITSNACITSRDNIQQILMKCERFLKLSILLVM
jgi:hypothetical protein